MRPTTILEKSLSSVINAGIALAISAPVYFFVHDAVWWKLSAIAAFYFVARYLNVSMRAVGSRWEQEYTKTQLEVWLAAYTASFATLFFWVFFPFDLFVANVVLLQVPTILLTGTTFHGFLAGGVRSVRRAD